MEYVISIAKRYNHARTHYVDPRNRGIKGAKPVLGIYFINEDGKLGFRKISSWSIPYYRTRLWKRRIYYCLECERKFIALVKKETDSPECPNCYSSTSICHKALVEAIRNELQQSLDAV